MSAVAVAVRCNWCSKQRPEFRTHRLASNQVICDYCLDWHENALEFLGGAVPKGCQECRASWEHLREMTPGVEIRMYVVQKDGILQLLCRHCVLPYVRGRSDLFKNTDFGNSLKL